MQAPFPVCPTPSVTSLDPCGTHVLTANTGYVTCLPLSPSLCLWVLHSLPLLFLFCTLRVSVSADLPGAPAFPFSTLCNTLTILLNYSCPTLPEPLCF